MIKIEIDKRFTIDENLFCNKCKKKLSGEEGYLSIAIKNYGYHDGKATNRLCLNCFYNLYQKIKKDKRNGKKIIERRTKISMIRKLR